MKLISLIALAACFSGAAFASVERVTFQATIPAPSEAGGMVVDPVVRTALVETLVEGSVSLQMFYALENTAPKLIAIEKSDAATGKLQAFRHVGMLGGKEYWTGWLPASLRSQLTVSWPSQGSTFEISRNAVESPRTDRALQDARLANDLSSALNDVPAATEEVKGFSDSIDWRQNKTYTWKYDEAKHKLWAGFLWDYKLGQLWKGYRTPTKKGTILTPSQNQKSSDHGSIQEYYANARTNVAAFNASNSKNLSPLDKFGIWASRKHGANWTDAPAWEGEFKHDNFKWGGYCNASVASGILFNKPMHGFVDAGIQFDPRDIVGALQSSNWVVDFLFFGNRCDKGCDDMDDPAPTTVIDLIDQYVGKQGSPIAVDLEADSNVGNETIIAAKLDVMEGDRATERYAELSITSITNFDDEMLPQDAEGTAPDLNPDSISTNKYGFKVILGANGKVASVKWDDKMYHPDFLWLPIATRDVAADSQDKNPNLKVDWVRELYLQSL